MKPFINNKVVFVFYGSYWKNAPLGNFPGKIIFPFISKSYILYYSCILSYINVYNTVPFPTRAFFSYILYTWSQIGYMRIYGVLRVYLQIVPILKIIITILSPHDIRQRSCTRNACVIHPICVYVWYIISILLVLPRPSVCDCVSTNNLNIYIIFIQVGSYILLCVIGAMYLHRSH